MELKNVIHYYLGCQVRITTNIEGNEVIEILTPALLQDIYDTIEDWDIIPDDKKPLIMLHSLEDMTEEDRNELSKLLIREYHVTERYAALKTAYLVSRSYDVFRLLESGQAKRILK